ncbi:MAG: hypothetical protein HY903_14545 [Deltaproteobacteria bacterium]|nr:hypothetical protein [Deltaproteobacteria bacterium]
MKVTEKQIGGAREAYEAKDVGLAQLKGAGKKKTKIEINQEMPAFAPSANVVDRRKAVLRKIFDAVPFDIPARDGSGAPLVERRKRPPMPWEDMRENWEPKVEKTVKLGEVASQVFERKGQLDYALGLWSSTRHGDAWETPAGQELARFALQRYSVAVTREDNQKIPHAAEVLWFADRIASTQERRGGALSPKWATLLEYAAFLHDVGYMNGGRAHSGKGGLDILFNLRAENPKLRALISQEDAEKIALLVELHGTAFPWDRVDPRLPGGHYVDVKVVDQIVDAAAQKRLVAAMRQENAAYLDAKNPEGGLRLAWLEDPKEVQELTRAGWILHSADNYLGVERPTVNPLTHSTQPPAKRELGLHAPLASVRQLEKYLRDQKIAGGLQSLRIFADDIKPLIDQIKSDIDVVGRAIASQEGSKPSKAGIEAAPPILERLRLLIASANSGVERLQADVAEQKSGAIARDLGELFDARFVKDVEATLAKLHPQVAFLLRVGGEGFMAEHLRAVRAVASGIAAQPDVIVDDLKA